LDNSNKIYKIWKRTISSTWLKKNNIKPDNRKENKMKGLTRPNISGNRPAYIEVTILNKEANADMTPKSKRDPFK